MLSLLIWTVGNDSLEREHDLLEAQGPRTGELQLRIWL